MAQFTAFNPQAEVAGSIICALIDSVGEKRTEVTHILAKYQLDTPVAGAWYSMQNYLQALHVISQTMGPHWLFNLGKGILNTEPTHNQDLHQALHYLGSLHHDNEADYYRLISYNQDQKEARVECRNPYPCYFDRGVLTSIFRNCQGNQVQSVHVALDNHRPSRLAGADVSYYTIMWQ